MRDYNFEGQVKQILADIIARDEQTPTERMKPAFKKNGISIKLMADISDSFEHSVWEEQDDLLEVIWRLDYVSICLDQTGYASVMISGQDDKELKPSQLKRLLKAFKEDGVMGWELAEMVDRMRA